jgi:hypothetical protein
VKSAFLNIPIKEEVCVLQPTGFEDEECDILAQGLIGLIEYSYHQGIPSFLKAHLQRSLGLSMLGSEQFQDG